MNKVRREGVPKHRSTHLTNFFATVPRANEALGVDEPGNVPDDDRLTVDEDSAEKEAQRSVRRHGGGLGDGPCARPHAMLLGQS